MKTYIKKHPVVEAIQWTNNPNNFTEILTWTNLKFAMASPLIWEQTGYRLNAFDGELKTPEGATIVPLSHWVVKHDEDVFYPVSDACFKRLYKTL